MFAAPFSYTLRGMTKLMEWRAPADPDSAAGISPDTSYPKSGIYRKCPPDSFYDFCPLKLRQRRSECPPEHRLCPMDFVSALMGVRRKRAAAGQLFVSNTV